MQFLEPLPGRVTRRSLEEVKGAANAFVIFEWEEAITM
jgi:hypothetical protein